jgi:hypothetical protein
MGFKVEERSLTSKGKNTNIKAKNKSMQKRHKV